MENLESGAQRSQSQATTLNVAANAATIAQRVVSNLAGNQLAMGEDLNVCEIFAAKLAGKLEEKRNAE